MKLEDFTDEQRAFIGGLCFEAAMQAKEEAIAEMREAACDYARLIQVENYDRNDIAVHRAYERLRMALGEPIGLKPTFGK